MQRPRKIEDAKKILARASEVLRRLCGSGKREVGGIRKKFTGGEIRTSRRVRLFSVGGPRSPDK